MTVEVCACYDYGLCMVIIHLVMYVAQRGPLNRGALTLCAGSIPQRGLRRGVTVEREIYVCRTST